MKKNKIIFILILVVIFIFTGVLLLNKSQKSKRYYTNKNENISEENEIAEIDNGKEEDKVTEQNHMLDQQNQDEKISDNEVDDELNTIEYVVIEPQQVEIPILMYHSISDADPDNGLLVSPEMFSEQMNWLKENGFTTMLLDDVVEAMTTGKVPKKPVAITFDDGYADNYFDAFPILKENNMKATFFIITNNTDKDGYYMSSDMLKEMKEYGMAIENHTAYHFELGGASVDDQKMSIEDGQVYLRDVIGVDSKYLCYPAGKYDENTVVLDGELGIKAAVTTVNGFANIEDGIYQLDRVRIAPMSIESFASIFSSFTE